MLWKSRKNADQEALYALKEFVHAIGLSRQEELNKFLPQHQNEIENLPQILKVRMKALKEVNPEKFSNSPELVLSTLAAADLIKQFPNGADKLERDVVDMVHKKYHLEQNSDVYSSLVPAIFHSYFRDVKNGNITQDGQIKNVEKSAVMRVVHNFKGDGVPIDAKKTVAEVKESTKSSNGCSEIIKKVRHSLSLLREKKLNATCSPYPNKPVARIEKSANVFDILNMKREIEK